MVPGEKQCRERVTGRQQYTRGRTMKSAEYARSNNIGLNSLETKLRSIV